MTELGPEVTNGMGDKGVSRIDHQSAVDKNSITDDTADKNRVKKISKTKK